MYVDAGRVGRRSSRRSASGGLNTVGAMTVKSWRSTQGSIVTSSGQPEFYALVRGAAEALGLQAVLEDLGWGLSNEVRYSVGATVGEASEDRYQTVPRRLQPRRRAHETEELAGHQGAVVAGECRVGGNVTAEARIASAGGWGGQP